MWKLSRMKGSVELLSTRMRTIDFEAMFVNYVQFWINFHSFKLRLSWSLDTDLIYTSIKKVLFVWSTKNLFSNFRINNCFCQIPLQSVFEVRFQLILDEFTFNKFVFRTRGSLLLSELLASSRILHSESPLRALKPPEVHLAIRNRVP